jgi:CRISPR-associated endonuclease Cas1
MTKLPTETETALSITETDHPFGGLSWYRLRATLTQTRSGPQVRSHPLVIIDAIQKSVTGILSRGVDTRPQVLFHIEHTKEQGGSVRGTYPVTFLLVGCDQHCAEFWRETLRLYLTDETAPRNYALSQLGEVEERSYAMLALENGDLPDVRELCLCVHTPLPFTPEPGKDRTHLSLAQFIRMYEKRFSRLFDRDIRYAGSQEVSLLSHCWHYSEIRHRSRSQPGATQYVKGCVGPLYLRGEWRALYPFILLGSELHTGTKLAHGQGYYTIEATPAPFFDTKLGNAKELAGVVEEVLDTHDDALLTCAAEHGGECTPELLTSELQQLLTAGTYRFSPLTAHTIKTTTKERRIEVPPMHDIVVLRHLARTLTPHVDHLFEHSSLGYRKGVSRDDAVARVRDVLNSEYRFVLRSDIDDFFPSIDHARLLTAVDALLPEGDTVTRELIAQAIQVGYIERGVVAPRERGLSQGSPLSPLLANLYFDGFDEAMHTLDRPYLRYADDFLLFAHTQEDAEALLAKVTTELGLLGLAPKEAKTRIVPVEEEFTFLGVRFTGTEVAQAPGELFDRAFKKPLYILEPYTYLGLAGDAVTVRKNGELLERIPLRRVSEIIVLARATVSTALMHRCVSWAIPCTFARESGYGVATIDPDSKSYHARAYAHATAYHALSATDRLLVAKDIVAAKLDGLQSLVKQKHAEQGSRVVSLLERTQERARQASSENELRGLEGAATKRVYELLNEWVHDPAFHFYRRIHKRPDRINSLMNVGYFLLFTHIRASLCALGLNPYLGFLHSSADNYESLVCDLEEPFRARVLRTVIRVVNLRMIGEDDFVDTPRGMRLTGAAYRTFVREYERDMARPSGEHGLTLRDAIHIQTLMCKRWVEGKGVFRVYRWEVL